MQKTFSDAEEIFFLFQKYVTGTIKKEDVRKPFLLFLLKYIPVFHPLMIYSIFDCSFSKDTLQRQLQRFEKQSLVSSVSVARANICSDMLLRNLFYITKKGYQLIEPLSDLAVSDEKKFIQRHSQAHAFHDYGVGMCTLSLLSSADLTLLGFDYEYAFSLDESIVSAAHRMKRAHRPDGLYLLSVPVLDRPVSFNLFLEHDAGSEPIGTLLGKLEEYNLHRIIRFQSGLAEANAAGSDLILFHSLRPIQAIPHCFRVASVKQLIDAIPEETTIEDFAHAVKDEELSLILSDFYAYTAAFEESYKKADLSEFCQRLRAYTEPSFLDWYRYVQAKTASTRLKNLYERLLPYFDSYLYQGEVTAYNSLFYALLFGGYRVPYVSGPELCDHLEEFYLCADKERQVRLAGLFSFSLSLPGLAFSAQYGEISCGYLKPIRLRNHFSCQSADLFFESGSDLGSLVRITTLLRVHTCSERRRQIVVLSVGNKEEAELICSYLNLSETSTYIPTLSFVCYDRYTEEVYSLHRQI